jgi:hypothetical protein
MNGMIDMPDKPGVGLKFDQVVPGRYSVWVVGQAKRE